MTDDALTHPATIVESMNSQKKSPVTVFHLVALLASVFLTACSTDSPAGKSPASGSENRGANPNGKVEWIDPSKIQSGPIQRDSLTDEQISRIKKLQQTFVEVDGQSLEKWIDNFKRDLDPDREIRNSLAV